MVRSLTRRGLAAAGALSALAGFVDGLGFVYLGGYFVSFMSGNTTRAGVDAIAWDPAAAAGAFALIAAFVVGAVVGTVASDPRRRGSGETRVLVCVVIALAAAAGAAAASPWIWLTGGLLALSMGALNTVFARGGEVSFGITYMTGALVKLGQAVVIAFRGGPVLGWLRYLILWLCIAAGAVLGAWAFAILGPSALWAPVAALAFAVAVRVLRSGSADTA